MVSRRTIGDPQFVLRQFWVTAEPDGHASILWDAKYLFHTLKQKNAFPEKQKRANWWNRDFAKTVRPLVVPQSPIENEANVCSTLLLITYMMASASATSTHQLKTELTDLLCYMLVKSTCALQGIEDVTLHGAKCKVANSGMVRGFKLQCHGNVAKTLQATWTAMHNCGVLQDDFNVEMHRVTDIATFIVSIFKFRSNQQQKTTRVTKDIISELRNDFIHWAAKDRGDVSAVQLTPTLCTMIS